MPINPNILLAGQLADISGAIGGGIDAYNQAQKNVLLKQQQQREAEVSGLQKDKLQLDIQAAKDKAQVAANRSIANKLKNDLIANNWDGMNNTLKTFGNALDPVVNQHVQTLLDKKDTPALISLINSADEDFYAQNPAARPKAVADERTTKQKEFDAIHGQGTPESIEALRKYLEQQQKGTTIAAVEEDKIVSKRAENVSASIDKLLQTKGITQEQWNQLQVPLAARDFASLNSMLKYMTGNVSLTDTQRAAMDSIAGARMLTYAQAKKRAEEAGKNIEDVKKSMFDSDQNIGNQIGLYQQALQALDQGAYTGWANQYFPSLRDSTLQLENARNAIGLDVASTSKLQPISNSDLQIIMNTAIPMYQSEPGVRQFLTDKIAALTKAKKVAAEGVTYFDKKDSSLSGWLDYYNKEYPTPQPSNLLTPSDVPGTPITPIAPTTPAAAPVNVKAPIKAGRFIIQEEQKK